MESLNSKFEYRNSKQCSNFQNSNVLNLSCFGHLEIRISDLFRISDFGFRIFIISVFLFGAFINICLGQDDLEFTLDIASSTTPTPKIFKPNIDLSGRGLHRENSWPQGLAAAEVIEVWQKDIGFSSIYRLQYNLWEIHELAKDKETQDRLLSNYETIMKKITDAGGTVILDIFGTPAGLGKALDQRSTPVDLKAFKALIKEKIKNLSCEKKYNLWYEVWTAPDLDEFFLGRRQEYLNIYRAVAEAIKELEAETKIHIPLGGPSTSWWFQSLDGNTIMTPEKSLIYELIKFCAHYKLPLDFITWHAYTTDPQAESELTHYNKYAVALIRDWLSYFRLDRNTPLIVDEWDYDSGDNVIAERHQKANIAATYIFSRLKKMYEASIDSQVYFCLEDFHNSKEGVVRNVGSFWFDPEASKYKGGPKSIYNAFRMLANLGDNAFSVSPKIDDEFVGLIATKTKDTITLIIYNYIDPEIDTNYLSRNIAALSSAKRKIVLDFIRSNAVEKIMHRELNISNLRAPGKVKAMLKKAQALKEQAIKFKDTPRNIKIGIKNLKSNYLYQRYIVDASCSLNAEFKPFEEKEISASDLYQEPLTINPYAVEMIILKPKPEEPKSAPAVATTPSESSGQNISNTTKN